MDRKYCIIKYNGRWEAHKIGLAFKAGFFCLSEVCGTTSFKSEQDCESLLKNKLEKPIIVKRL